MPTESIPKGPSAATFKKLFAFSGNRCAFPGCTTRMAEPNALVGEVCHIAGARPDSARYDPNQSARDRHSPANLVLLCPTHHKRVDDDENTYTVSVLQKMKAEHEEAAGAVSEAETSQAISLFELASVTSVNQTGGITANTINYTVNHLNATDDQPRIDMGASAAHRSLDGAGSGRVLGMEDSSFASPGGVQLAELESVDETGLTSPFVYLHSGPSAWLRIIPTVQKALTRFALNQLIEGAHHRLYPFGTCARTQNASNVYGATVLGYDTEAPETIATRIAHVLPSGEMWGINKDILRKKVTDPRNTLRIPWPDIQREFQQTLMNFLQFAQFELHLELPITIVAGLGLIGGAIFTREKSAWFTDPPRETKCLEDRILHCWAVSEYPTSPPEIPEKFYVDLFDACLLDFSQEPRVHTWPR